MKFDGTKIVKFFPDLHELRIYNPKGEYWRFKIEDPQELEKAALFLVSALAMHAIDIAEQMKVT